MQKILLVDDREDNLTSIESILEPDGYIFVKANSGAQALKILLAEFDFALILMDVKMPNLNGFETAALIYERDKLKHIPIIFITAYNYGEEGIFKGYKAGAVDYIYKPINSDLLRAKVGVFIDLYKKNHRLLLQEQNLRTANESLAREAEMRRISQEQVYKLNMQLLDSIDQLKLMNEDLDNFVYIASHDLQEPLRKIRMFTDAMLTKEASGLNDNSKEYVKKIERSSRRMQLLIKDILSFSRFSSNTEPYTETDLNEIIKSVEVDLEQEITEKKAIITVKGLPVYAVIPSMFAQLFHNLLYNAIKFSRKNTRPEIHISAENINGTLVPNVDKKRQHEDFCAITITDNGIGFEEKFADQIFVIFKRLHTSAAYEGTGIGLAICKKIIDKHNGYIYAKSKPGIGSEFTIALPLVKDKKAVAQ